MGDLVQCTRCKKITIDEEYDVHRCLPQVKDSIKIKYATYLVMKDSDPKIIMIMGLNGIRYEFIEIPENKEYTKIPYQPKSNNYKTTADETEPNFSIVLYYAPRKSRYNGICLRCFTSSQARKKR